MRKNAILLFFVIAVASARLVISPETIQGRIHGGSDALAGQVPWHVWVRSLIGNSAITCGGSLIASNWVLTAAHCVQGSSSVTVGAGSNTLSSPLIQMVVPYVVVHPAFNATNYANDLALLELPAILVSTNNIIPIRLPMASELADYLNAAATFSGFGLVSNSSTTLSESLKVVSMRTVISESDCRSAYLAHFDSYNHDLACARGQADSTQSTCIGDSGGAMVLTPSMFLYGIATFTSSRGCGSGDLSVFTRINRFLPWINAVTGIPLLD